MLYHMYELNYALIFRPSAKPITCNLVSGITAYSMARAIATKLRRAFEILFGRISSGREPEVCRPALRSSKNANLAGDSARAHSGKACPGEGRSGHRFALRKCEQAKEKRHTYGKAVTHAPPDK